MDENDYSDLLSHLKFNLRENGGDDCCCGCSVFSDNELLTLLKKHRGDVRAASYEGLIIKAENDSVTLPDGLEIESNHEYWLNLASLYRPCKAHNIPRADEVINHEHEQ